MLAGVLRQTITDILQLRGLASATAMNGWVTIGFDASLDFAKPHYTVSYGGYSIEVVRGGPSQCHNLFLETREENSNAAEEAGRRFLSELAWLFHCSIVFLGSVESTGRGVYGDVRKLMSQASSVIDLTDYEQAASTSEQSLALAIYREGISCISPFYEFLNYFRIINIHHHDRPSQISCINDCLNAVKKAVGVVQQLREKGINDIGEHLYKSGRCAIAHAKVGGSESVADPDDPKDNRRIQNEVDLVKEIAEILIRKEFKVPSCWELYVKRARNNLCKSLGEELVHKLLSRPLDKVEDKFTNKILTLSLRVQDSQEEYKSFESIKFQVEAVGNGKVLLSSALRDFPLLVRLAIDVSDERCGDAHEALQIIERDTNTQLSQGLMLDTLKLKREYLLNGRLEIRNAETGELVIVLQPCMPVNVDIDVELTTIEKAIQLLTVSSHPG